MFTARRFLVVGLATTITPVAYVMAAAPAVADCTSGGGVTVCAQGDVRTTPSGGGSSGPYYPYPCEDDYFCYDGGLSVVLDPGDNNRPRPPQINNDLPGRGDGGGGRPGGRGGGGGGGRR